MQVGDWGRRGQLNQTEVASMMALKASFLQPDFVISVGDNFYPSAPSQLSPVMFLHLLYVSDALIGCFLLRMIKLLYIVRRSMETTQYPFDSLSLQGA
jgi:hypothetical protein